MTLRVLMSGDSAGGNLVAAMHVYMQQHNLQKFMADHLLLVYANIHTSLQCLQSTHYHLITPNPHLLQLLGLYGVVHCNDA